MDRHEFITYIKHPSGLNKNTLPGLEKLTADFPYCQSLRILHLLNMKMTGHVMYGEELKSTAACIADRKRLRELIKSLQDEEQVLPEPARPEDIKPEETRPETTADVHEEKTAKPEPVVPVIEQDEEARLLKLKDIVENRLREIASEKEALRLKEEEESGAGKMSKEEIIDKFIREEPSISRPKSDFFNPVKVARSSREEKPGLVSETLARIHVQQGNIEKAIEIYRRLSLNFPEKSRYFAAQIEKLSSEK